MSAESQIRSLRGVRAHATSRESGFAYILALMVMAAVMIAAMVTIEKGITQAKRRQEELTIWRGEQYIRAIRQFYKKADRYPQSIDELQKGFADIHFLRPSAYKNPMNKADGTWRMIYVNPAGQLIGSTRYANLQQMALIVLNNGQMPTQVTGIPGINPQVFGLPGQTPNATNTGLNGSTGSNGQNPNAGSANSNPNNGAANTDNGNNNQNQGNQENGDSSGGDNSGANQSPPNNPNSANPSSPQQPPEGILTGSSNGTDQPVNPLLTMKPTGPVTGQVVGAFFTGVALIQDIPSQKVYEGGKKYINWEFIWNPMIDQARALASGQGQQGATGVLGGMLGGAPGAPGAPGTNGGNGGNGFGFGGLTGGQQTGNNGQQPNGQQPQQPPQTQQPDQNQPQQ